MDGKPHPVVSSYLNVHLYLQDVYRFRKLNEKYFSYEHWSQELGLTSKSYLRFAILGKRRISDSLAQKFCDSLKLSEPEKEYFCILILYTQTSQPEQKRRYGKKLTQLLRESLPMAEVEPVESLMANPLYLMIRNFLSFPDAFKSTAFLAKTFGIEVSATESILERLSAAGFIQFKNDEWCAVHEDIKIADKPKNETLLEYHRLSLARAIQAQQMPFDERHYRSLGLVLSRKEYADYLNELDGFAKKIYAKYNQNTITSRRVYQINFNAFPWTEEIQPVFSEAGLL